jgi:hypothetical protein
MTNWLMRGSWSGGPTGPRNGVGRPAWADRPRPISAQFVASFAWCWFPSLLDPSPLLHVGPCHQFLSELDEAPCLARFNTFLARSSEFSILSSWVLGLLGVVFTSLLDLYRASRSCHEVLNELIPEVLLSRLKPFINTKLQNRHAQGNLLYHGS